VKTANFSLFRTLPINSNEVINKGIVFTELFATESGSNGVFEFYDLFKAYLLDEDKRKQINDIIR